MKKLIIIGFITMAPFLSMANIRVGWAEEPQIPSEFQIPRSIEGTGTHFELSDSQYLNITLDSLQPIKLILESMPEMVTMYIESASEAVSTEINLSGFAARDNVLQIRG
jgi:hypothetical protein